MATDHEPHAYAVPRLAGHRAQRQAYLAKIRRLSAEAESTQDTGAPRRAQ